MLRLIFLLIVSAILIVPNIFAATTIYDIHKRTWGEAVLTSEHDWEMCSTSTCDPPEYVIWYKRYISSPSLSGSSTKFFVGGTHAYMDGFWNQKMFRDTSEHPDAVKNAHNFVYDAYFYIKDANPMHGIEFDINQFLDGKQYTWGHQCRGPQNGAAWDVWAASSWDPGKGTWQKNTGIPCKVKSNAWNHVRITGKRTWDNKVKYVSIYMNGTTYYPNRVYSPGPQNKTWRAVTINFQLDGNRYMTDYAVWLDKVKFTYW